MESKGFLLLKTRLIAQLGLNTLRFEKDKRKRKNKILLNIVIVIVVAVFAFYCGGLAFGLAKVGMTEVIPICALTLASFIVVFFTIFKANGELFAFKDYDLLMSLPVKIKTVIASRFWLIYFWNTLLTIVIMLPMGIVYCVFEKPNIMGYIMWLITILIGSLIPTTIATVVGAFITWISSKFRHVNIVVSLLTFVLVIMIVAGSVMLTGIDDKEAFLEHIKLEKIINQETGELNEEMFSGFSIVVVEQLTKAYPIANLFHRSITQNNIGLFFIFIGISCGWYWLFITLLSIKYKEINTAVSTSRARSNYKMKRMKRKGIVFALYKKELKRFFSTTVYLVNTGVGAIMALVLSVALLVIGPEKMVNSMGYPEVIHIVNKVVAFVIAAMLAMSCTTSVALSLEGKNVWILKSLPIEPKTIYDSKILVNLTISIPASIISAIFVILAIQPDIWNGILVFFIPITYSFFVAVLGIFINNRLCNYDWESETQVVKQSIASLGGVFGGFLLAIIGGMIVVVFGNIDFRIVSTGIVLVVWVITVLLYKREIKRAIF